MTFSDFLEAREYDRRTYGIVQEHNHWDVLAPWVDVPDRPGYIPATDGVSRPHVCSCPSREWAEVVARLLTERGVRIKMVPNPAANGVLEPIPDTNA